MMKAVLFDFGGTIDTNGIHWSEKFWEVYQRHSIPVSKQDYEKAYVFAENNMAGQIKPDYSFKFTLTTQIKLQIEYLNKMELLDSGSLDIVVHELARSCYDDVRGTIKDAKKYLDRLSQNYLLGVISNFYGNLESVLKEFSIAGYFNSIVDSEIAGLKKPNPEIFLFSLKELNAEPDEAWMVGDSYDRDIQPAKIAGIKTVWLDGKSWQRPAITTDADFIINSLCELNNIIN
jgi:putative hydrolase of the HAD superfamily